MGRFQLTPDMVALRTYITESRCPFCSDHPEFRSLASHVQPMHGVTAYELREMAGLSRTTSICSPDYRVTRQLEQHEVLQRNPQRAKEQLARGHAHDVIVRRETEWRPETTERQLADRNRPERIAAFKASMAIADHKTPALERTPEQVAAQTLRVQRARERWASRVGKEQVSAVAKRASKQAHAKIDEYRKDADWLAQWKDKVTLGAQKHRKVTSEQEKEIMRLLAEGQSQRDVGKRFGVSQATISRTKILSEKIAPKPMPEKLAER